jgi:hypothetical protein
VILDHGRQGGFVIDVKYPLRYDFDSLVPLNQGMIFDTLLVVVGPLHKIVGRT